MELGNPLYLVLAIVAVIIGLTTVKKVAGCILRLVVLAVLAAVLYVIFMGYTADKAEAEAEPAVEMHD